MFSGELLHIYNGTGSTIAYNGTNYPNGSYVPLGRKVAYSVAYCKLWASDTGRNMRGENKGTLVGIFPKITVSLGRMSEGDASAIINLTMQASTYVRYYDVGKKDLVAASFYFGDVSAEIEKQRSMYHKGINFTIIANKTR